MQSHKPHAFLLHAFLPLFDAKCFRVFFDMPEPLFYRRIWPCRFFQLSQNFIQILALHIMGIRVVLYKIIISDPLADILNSRIGRHLCKHFHIPFKLINAVEHPVFVAVKLPDLLKRYLRPHETVPTDIPLRPVHHLQKIPPLSLAQCKPEICQDILCCKVIIDIREMFFHLERDMALNELLHKGTRIRMDTEKDCHVFRRGSRLHLLFDRIRHISCLFHRIF